MLLIKYHLYYSVSHYHLTRMKACIKKQEKYLENKIKFAKYGKKFCKHAIRCDELQLQIDILKQEISNKYNI